MVGIARGAQASRWTPAIDFEQCERPSGGDGGPAWAQERGREGRIDRRLSRHHWRAQSRAQSRSEGAAQTGTTVRAILPVNSVAQGSKDDHMTAPLHGGILNISMPVVE